MSKSHMNFTVDENAVICHLFDGEIKGRMASRKNVEAKEEYKRRGIINSSPSIVKCMRENPSVFQNKKLIHTDGTNLFEGMITLSSLAGTDSYEDILKNRMKIVYDLTDSEIDEIGGFFSTFRTLGDAEDIREKMYATEKYKNSIEKAWEKRENRIMEHITGVLGYEPENVGKVNVCVMYPTFDAHRCYQLSENKSYLYFAKSRERDSNRILAYLSHQAVHQPMLPYKRTMTKSDKDKFHAFIKFLTDKDVYNFLSGKSYLDIVTKKEDPEIMSKIYPYWLGYRYRNVDKIGQDPETEIERAISRDKEYFNKLPQNSKKRKLYALYNFDNLDPKKIADIFRENRGITPYEFVQKFDFDRRDLVCKNQKQLEYGER